MEEDAALPMVTPPSQNGMEENPALSVAKSTTDAPIVGCLPLEIWMIVAEQIRNRKTLKAFAATCRSFYTISQALLYTERELHLHLLNIHSDDKSLPPSLKSTKDLRIVLHEFVNIPWEPTKKGLYASLLALLLSQLENLRSFEWHDNSFVRYYDSSRILRKPRVMKKLKSLPLLQHILIEFSGEYLGEMAEICWIPLTGFTNLTSLELYQFYGEDFNGLAKELAEALRESPNLKKLGLGMACNAKTDGMPETYVLEHEGTFFEKLCLYYGSLPGAPRPLPLDTLRLGNGICLLKSKSETTPNYLAKLVKIDGLKVLHFFNGLVEFYDDDGDDDDDIGNGDTLQIDCALLEDCKSLYQLSITRITSDIVRWLSGPARTVQELFVTEQYPIFLPDLRLFNQVKLNKISMLYVTDADWGSHFEEEVWSDTDSSDLDSSDLDSSSDLEESSSGTNPSTGETDKFVASEDPRVMTILDRLYAENDLSYLKKLSLTFQFETQWEHFTKILPVLKNLQQLHLRGQDKMSSRPPIMPKPQPGKSSYAVALEYAQAIHELCPSLRYLAIGNRPAWHIQFVEPVGENDTGLRFVPVTEEDMDLIEMFACNKFADQSGLLAPEYPSDRTEYYDVEARREVRFS